MEMITENTIDRVVELFENQALDYEKAMQEFAAQQPALLAFLLSDQEGALTDDERDFMLYLAMVVWRSVSETAGACPSVSAQRVEAAEEMNWEKMEAVTSRKFRERLDVFFEKTPQEDLLAFVEDSLTTDIEEEEEWQITPEGREPIFIALKTMIDVLTESR